MAISLFQVARAARCLTQRPQKVHPNDHGSHSVEADAHTQHRSHQRHLFSYPSLLLGCISSGAAWQQWSAFEVCTCFGTAKLPNKTVDTRAWSSWRSQYWLARERNVCTHTRSCPVAALKMVTCSGTLDAMHTYKHKPCKWQPRHLMSASQKAQRANRTYSSKWQQEQSTHQVHDSVQGRSQRGLQRVKFPSDGSATRRKRRQQVGQGHRLLEGSISSRRKAMLGPANTQATVNTAAHRFRSHRQKSSQ